MVTASFRDSSIESPGSGWAKAEDFAQDNVAAWLDSATSCAGTGSGLLTLMRPGVRPTFDSLAVAARPGLATAGHRQRGDLCSHLPRAPRGLREREGRRSAL